MAEGDSFGLSVIPQLGPYYPPDRWVPVRIDARNMTRELVDGYVELPVNNDVGGVKITVRIVAPARSKITAPAYVYLPESPPNTLLDTTKVQPITIGEWRSQQGATLARCEMLAKPISSVPSEPGETSEDGAGGLIFCVEDLDSSESRESYSAFDFGRGGDLIHGMRTLPAFMSANYVPRLRVGYDAARCVVINGSRLDDMDLTQREALTDYLLAGGRVVVFCPRGSANPAGTWFEPYFPVQLVGERYATKISGTRADGRVSSFDFKEPADVAEAVAGDGVVVWQDKHYVHTAYKRVGLGRVIFASFPPGGIDLKNEDFAQIWTELLAYAENNRDWNRTKLAQRSQAVLDSLVGRPTVPWSRAAMLCGIYVVAILGVQLVASPEARPRAFLITTALSAVSAIGLLGFTFVGQRDELLVEARFVTLDICPEGGGVQREVLTFLGQNDPDLTLRAVRPDVSLRPLLAKDTAPTIQLNPFTAINAGAHAAELKRAWQVECALPYRMRLLATGRFDEQGLSLQVDNATDLTLDAPLLILDGKSFRLSQIPPGPQIVRVTESSRNVRGDFTNASLIASTSEKLRGTIVQSALTPAQPTAGFTKQEQRPMFIAWLAGEAPRLLELRNAQPGLARGEAMVRGEMRIEASPVGSKILVPGAMTIMYNGGAASLPFDPMKREWLRTPQEGPFLVGFGVPPEAGVVRPTRATLRASIDAPQYQIVVRKQQVARGMGNINPAGEAIATWNSAIAEEQVEINLTDEDFDADGRVWLAIHALPTSASGQGLVPQWNFRDLELSIEGEVVSSPKTPAATRQVLTPVEIDPEN